MHFIHSLNIPRMTLDGFILRSKLSIFSHSSLLRSYTAIPPRIQPVATTNGGLFNVVRPRNLHSFPSKILKKNSAYPHLYGSPPFALAIGKPGVCVPGLNFKPLALCYGNPSFALAIGKPGILGPALLVDCP